MQRPTIGFIGLGAMGEPMAGRLLDAGFRVVSSINRSREAIERLAAKGIEECETPREVGDHADILMTIVWDEEQTDRVLRGDGGALSTLREGAIVVVMSTMSPVYCQELAREAAVKGVDVIDCPVSGLVAGARDGTLTLMAGGDAATIDRCREAFDVLGTMMHCGDIGAGQAMKIGNNAISLGTWALVQEVREVVGAYGMELDRFMEILNVSTGRSFVSKNFPMPRRRVTWPAMPVKDLSLCLDVARAFDVEAPLVKASLDSGQPEA